VPLTSIGLMSSGVSHYLSQKYRPKPVFLFYLTFIRLKLYNKGRGLERALSG